MKTSFPKCRNCKDDIFELRVLRDESVASARCVNCLADYLLLDSGDYWFDVIQSGYPRLTRCFCKNAAFRLRIDYNIRDDGDIDYIEAYSICSACEKMRRQLELIVAKSPVFRKVTASLLEMLRQEFVSWRGPHCFDNPEVNVRVFGDRFLKKAKAKGKR